MVKANLPSAVDLFKQSYERVKANINVYALVYAVPAAMVIAGVIQVVDDTSRHGWNWSSAFGSSIFGPTANSDSNIHAANAIFSFLLMCAAIISYGLAVILNLRASEGKAPRFSAIWRELWGNWLWLKLLGLSILTVLLLVVGFLLLVVPGVILLWRLFLAPYILIDKKTKVVDALSVSWNMTKGYAWPIYGVVLFSFVLALTGAIPLVGALISFLLGTAYAVAPALRYQEIKKS